MTGSRAPAGHAGRLAYPFPVGLLRNIGQS